MSRGAGVEARNHQVGSGSSPVAREFEVKDREELHHRGTFGLTQHGMLKYAQHVGVGWWVVQVWKLHVGRRKSMGRRPQMENVAAQDI